LDGALRDVYQGTSLLVPHVAQNLRALAPAGCVRVQIKSEIALAKGDVEALCLIRQVGSRMRFL